MTPAEFYVVGATKPFLVLNEGDSCKLADETTIQGAPVGFAHKKDTGSNAFAHKYGRGNSMIVSGNPDIMIRAEKTLSNKLSP